MDFFTILMMDPFKFTIDEDGIKECNFPIPGSHFHLFLFFSNMGASNRQQLKYHPLQYNIIVLTVPLQRSLRHRFLHSEVINMGFFSSQISDFS